MAVYTEDWSGSTLAAEPTGWTKRLNYTSATPTEVQEDADSPGGRRCRIRKTTTQRSLLSFNAVDADADRATVQIRALVRLTVSGSGMSNTHGGLGGRGAGASGSETLATTALAYTSGSQVPAVRHVQYSSGAATVLSEFAAAWVSGELFWLTVQLSGSDLTVSLAAHNTPNVIIHTSTETTALSAAGWVGLFTFAAGNTPLNDYLWVGVGTGADDAPYPVGVLSSATGSATGATTASGSVSVNLSHGTAYAVLTTSAMQPTATQIKAGQDHAGVAAAFSGSSVVSAIGAQAFSATGLTASTAYFWHFLHVNADTVDSNRISSASFTTSAASLVLRNTLPFYADAGEVTIASDTGVTVTVFSTGPDALVGVFTGLSIVSGHISITDAAFDTLSEAFQMAVRKGAFSRVVDGTVVNP